MRSLLVTLNWNNAAHEVGTLHISESRGHEHYQFIYTTSWVNSNIGFAIDPALELISNTPYYSNQLWGAFQDISPDRWGRLVQDRIHNQHLNESDYILGVSDLMRMGALRLSDVNTPEVFLAAHHNVPKLIHLRTLENAAMRLESGQETSEDLQMLAQPGSSLGGARPKAAIEDNNLLWIAKFQSKMDTERTSCWEATMLDLAHQTGIQVANHKVLNAKSERPVLLVERFDRHKLQRIPFISAMTLLERNESNTSSASYLELSDALSRYSPHPKHDKNELWKRMVFNAMTGNIDDHLRNHGFLRHEKGWKLSPAYDLNPTNQAFTKRTHTLSFDGEQAYPSLELCIALAEYFSVDNQTINQFLKTLYNTLSNWHSIAKKNGLRIEEIKHMHAAFEHQGFEKLGQSSN